jgi:hypothetical protein
MIPTRETAKQQPRQAGTVPSAAWKEPGALHITCSGSELEEAKFGMARLAGEYRRPLSLRTRTKYPFPIVPLESRGKMTARKMEVVVQIIEFGVQVRQGRNHENPVFKWTQGV